MIETKTVTVGDITIGGKNPFALITGPCQLESLDHCHARFEQNSWGTGLPYFDGRVRCHLA
ncbi:MAG: hypothetical protein ABJJ53_09950 [Sulfitobacter sp.]